MSMKVLSVSVLLLAMCLYFESFADATPPGGRHPGKSRMCCVSVTTVNVSRNVTGNKYREQQAKKPCVHAIIFSTINGQVCADPKAKWVQQLIANMTKE
ncbi:chemokine (C-C motif) ligand 34b, duplicate 4 [Amphiprion ocellaris]|uniref:Chemokine interleukin-8-like domain-containing protein n=1 Tax=Amphiprion ocellaris TaxID=80972 RepID=A0A3Q1ARS6_AMPOC|nr:chemokine (C-C motif) ligand 34b, duplicate 4 [Amphiprion ocellaris]